EAAAPSDIPLQQISVKVAKLEQPNENNAVLYLRTPRSRTLRFLAGQYINITGAVAEPYDGYVASCPCNGMIVQIHVQRNGHPFSDYVFNKLKTGDNLDIEGPFGEFTLDESSRRPVVMVAQDIGFAPMKSLIEHAIALDLPQSMMLFWLAEQGQDHYQSNYCRSWEDALDSFLYRPLHLDTLHNGQNDYHGACQYVLGRTPVETEIDLYLSGPKAMLSAFSDAFSEKGTPSSRIRWAKPLWDDRDGQRKA
ncbi:MAG: FAD-binding oxidoreductase, partial [Gammaproteobacteria bacterium]